MCAAETLARLGIAILATLFVLVPAGVRADGAFPDSQNILTPADREQEIVMATNFGVVYTTDAGKTWLWTCEQPANSLGWLYQIGLAPRHRVFAVANRNLVYSDNMTCGWNISGGSVTGQEVVDAWVDRALPDRVLVIAIREVPGGNNIYSIVESKDGGATFGAVLYVAPSGDTITGLETALSDSRAIYLTMSVGTKYVPTLAQSLDGGTTWQQHDMTASLGAGNMRLIAVDAQNPNKVFLLWNDPVAGQAVAVTEDGGATASIRLSGTSDGTSISAFVRTATGALLVATNLNSVGGLFRSKDGGLTFQPLPDPPAIRGFSERNGLVYAATNNFGDGYALGTSSDDGEHWTPVMKYNDVRAIAGCLKADCQVACDMLAEMVWPAAVCSADAPPPSSADAGTGGSDAGADGPVGGGGGAGGSGGKSGGGCRVPPGSASDGSATIWLWAVALLSFLLARGRARRSGRRPVPRSSTPTQRVGKSVC